MNSEGAILNESGLGKFYDESASCLVGGVEDETTTEIGDMAFC